MRDSKRLMVKQVIERFIAEGEPKPHHFYVTFRTQDEGVDIDPALVEKYPDEITIVIENSFYDLGVEDDAFEVTLKFGGVPKYLRVPFAAISQFSDPSQNFMIAIEQFDDEVKTPPIAPKSAPASDVATGDDTGTVVSLDQFRKKGD
jgi:hypothetical protein